MKVKFYGTRGSIASSGPETLRYGGNTSCVMVEAGDQRLIFDAGTGIRKLGAEVGPTDFHGHLFFSHLHWDHIQGFPFFTPAYVPGNALNIYAAKTDGAPPVREVLHQQMTAPTFPVGIERMNADLRFFDVPEAERIRLGSVSVRQVAVDHPNGCVAYRVDHRQKSVVYATDLEHDPSSGEVGAGLHALCRGADLLIFDAMYTPEEYAGERGPCRVGWGHSTFEAGARLAEAAGVETLCLFHHDPSHDDAFMDGLLDRAQKRRSSTMIAREGLALCL